MTRKKGILFFLLSYFFLLSLIPDPRVWGQRREARSAVVQSQLKQKTKVIKHIHREENHKVSLKDLSSYAVLGKDPKGSLPSSFTICSSVMREATMSACQNFFSLLGQNGGAPFVQSRIFSNSLESMKSTFYYKIKDHAYSANMTIPIVFPYQWTHS